MIDLLVVLALLVVIVLLLGDRYFTNEQTQKKEDRLLEENSRLVKAVIAKNANDYVMTTSMDKVVPEKAPPVNTDLIPEESLSDEEFMESIGKQVKQ